MALRDEHHGLFRRQAEFLRGTVEVDVAIRCLSECPLTHVADTVGEVAMQPLAGLRRSKVARLEAAGMSLRPQSAVPPVPDDTSRVARAAFRRGNPYVLLRDRLGTVFARKFFEFR